MNAICLGNGGQDFLQSSAEVIEIGLAGGVRLRCYLADKLWKQYGWRCSLRLSADVLPAIPVTCYGWMRSARFRCDFLPKLRKASLLESPGDPQWVLGVGFGGTSKETWDANLQRGPLVSLARGGRALGRGLGRAKAGRARGKPCRRRPGRLPDPRDRAKQRSVARHGRLREKFDKNHTLTPRRITPQALAKDWGVIFLRTHLGFP